MSSWSCRCSASSHYHRSAAYLTLHTIPSFKMIPSKRKLRRCFWWQQHERLTENWVREIQGCIPYQKQSQQPAQLPSTDFGSGWPHPLIWLCVGDSYCDQAPSLLVIDSVDGNSKGTTESIRHKRGMQMQINVTFVNCMSWIRESNLHSGLSLPCGGSGSFLMEMGTFLFSIYISSNKRRNLSTKFRRNKLFGKMQMVSVWPMTNRLRVVRCFLGYYTQIRLPSYRHLVDTSRPYIS